ncbi:TPA: hypothetical protein ACOVJJ_005011 [Klebsiella oxytoca]
MKSTETLCLPVEDASKIDAVASVAEPLGLLPNLEIYFRSIDSIQLELRAENGDLIWRDLTFSSDFVNGFLPYLNFTVTR